MHCARSFEAGTGACAAADCFVILDGIVAKGEIVHGALCCSHDPQCAEQRIGDGLACLDVAGDHSGGKLGIQHRASWSDDGQRPQAARIQWNLRINEAPEDIKHSCGRDRARRIEIRGALGACTREVDCCTARGWVDRDSYLNDGAIIHFVHEGAVGEPADGKANLFFGMILHKAHVSCHCAASLLHAQARQFTGTRHACGELCLQVGDVLRGIAGGVSP